MYPFIGLDLRRFDGGRADTVLRQATARFGSIKARKSPDQLRSGDHLGIKLYPPMGAGPVPDPSEPNWRARRDHYLEFFRLCARRQIPITAHCQQGSYRAYKVSKKDIERLAGPQKWAAVLGDPECAKLRINFAHFGGEDELVRMMRNYLYHGLLDEGKYRRTWTWRLLRLVKAYPNAFADISAYDFNSQEARWALQALLALDEVGQLDQKLRLNTLPGGSGTYKLRDKLLWGSDVPMTVKSYADYKTMFDRFEQAVDVPLVLSRLKRAGHRLPPGALPTKATIVDDLVSANPYRFLFGAAP